MSDDDTNDTPGIRLSKAIRMAVNFSLYFLSVLLFLSGIALIAYVVSWGGSPWLILAAVPISFSGLVAAFYVLGPI